MAKFITRRRRKFPVQFSGDRTASVRGGQLAAAALLGKFGLAQRLAAESRAQLRAPN